MNYSDPRKLSVFNAIVITIIYVALSTSLALILPETVWWVFILLGISLYVIVYLMFRYTVEKFIYSKIKIIYKTIHNLKLKKEEKIKKGMPVSGDLIDQAHQEVVEWGEERRKEIEDLKKLEAYRREYIGNVSHELKTPIFNIQGYVLTLLDGGLDDPDINKEYLLRTEKSINRMIAIIEDLEAISQLESGELKLNIEVFDILALTKEVLEFLEIKARKRKNTVFFAHNYDKPLMVSGDKQRIRQVLTNLIDNAIKYGKNKNGNTKLSYFDMDEHILVEVTDDGIGIEEENINRLFERFYRTDKGRSREQGGTGLGLAIVKHIIEAHKQTINVRSRIGVGTTFAFTLKKE
jgi:two-component system phosphate regulon sensor histidine kinase PhoR